MTIKVVKKFILKYKLRLLNAIQQFIVNEGDSSPYPALLFFCCYFESIKVEKELADCRIQTELNL